MSDRPDVMGFIAKHWRKKLVAEHRVIEVPEMGLVGDHAMHIWPTNMLEEQQINRAARGVNDVAIVVETLLVRARYADRSQIFPEARRDQMMREGDPYLYAKVVKLINSDLPGFQMPELDGEPDQGNSPAASPE